MNRIVDNWRLKLLALLLTLGLLGAVAFSENPVTVAPVPAAIDYDNLPPGTVVINPLLKSSVNVEGLNSAVNPLRSANPPGIHFHVNLKDARTGAQLTFYAHPGTLPAGVSWTGDPVPVTVGIDRLEVRTLPIEVRTPRVAPGFKVLDVDDKGKPATFAQCGNSAEPCLVKVTAPATLLDQLKAYVLIDDVVSGTSTDSPSQPVRFEQNGRQVDLARFNTLPNLGVDPSTVNVHITAQQTQVTRQVAVTANVTGRPACGYAITGITYNPSAFVQITGPSDKVARTDGITLPQGIDVSGATANQQKTEVVPTDPGVTASPGSVTVTVTISKQVDCTASTPTPLPSPSPRTTP